MVNEKLNQIKQKISDIYDLEGAIVEDIRTGVLGVYDVPENILTTRIMIAFLLRDAMNYNCFPHHLKCRELALLATQLNRELAEGNVMPVEIHAWVAGNMNAAILALFPEHLRDEYFCSAAIQVSPLNISYLPRKLYESSEYLQGLISVSAQALRYTPTEYVTEELCEIAFKQDDFDLAVVPERFRSKSFSLRAFEKNYKSIFATPVEYWDMPLLIAATRQCVEGELQNLIEITPEELKTEKFWKVVVQKDSSLLRLVPENIISEHFIVDVAPYIKKATNLSKIRQPILENPTVKYALVKSNPLLLQAIPNSAKDYMLCTQAVGANGMALEFVPSSCQDTKIYHLALDNNGLSIKHIPAPYRDESIPLKAVQQNGEAIEHVKPSYVNLELCKTAIRNNARAVYFLPQQFKNEYELQLLAIESNPHDLKIIDQRHRSVEICRIAFRSNYRNWEHIPVPIRTDSEINSLYRGYKKEGLIL